MDDGSGGHRLPQEWHPGPYGYDPYTNTFLPLPEPVYDGYYGGWGVDQYSWNPPDHRQGPMDNYLLSPHSSSASVPLGRRPPRAAAQRGRGRGGRHRTTPAPRQHGGPGLLGSDPSSQQAVPVPRRSRVPDDQTSSSQPAPVPVPNPQPPASSPSPSSHAMAPPVKDSHGVDDVSIAAAAKNNKDDDAQQDDVSSLAVGLAGSSTSATDKKKKRSSVDLSMARSDGDDQSDVLGLNVYMAKKRRLLSTKKASSSAADAKAAAARKKTRLGWGQGLAKYENQFNKKDYENAHKLVAHDGPTAEPASSHGSSLPPAGSLEMAEMRVSHITTASAALFSKGSSRLLTGVIHDCESKGQVHAVPREGSPPTAEDNSDAIAVSEFASFQKRDGPIPPDEKVQDSPPRKKKVVVTWVQKPSMVLTTNALSAAQQETNGHQGSKKLKEWSQEEKDIFSEKITSFGMNFSKISSFLRHKTTADCMKYYFEQYKSKCHKEAQKCLPTTVIQSQENCSNEYDAAPLLSGIATVTATKNYERMKGEAEDVKKPVNQICHESAANLLAHSLPVPDKGHGESSLGENEQHVTGKVLVGELNAAPSPLGMRSSQAAGLTISKSEAQVPENFNKDSCSSKEAVGTTRCSSKVKKNVPKSVLIANHGDEGNCVAGGSCARDIVKITFFPDEISAKLANDTIINGGQMRSGARTPELCSSLKECNSLKATEKKVANSNIEDDGKKDPADMKNPSSKDNPACNTSDPAPMLTGPAFVQHMMEHEEATAMEKKESEKNDGKVKGMDGNNQVLCAASKHGSGIQLSCEVNSHKEIEKVDSIPSPEGNNGPNAGMGNPTKDSSPGVATNNSNAAVATRDELIQQLRAEVAALKGKGIIPMNPEVNDLNMPPPMEISSNGGAPKTYHLPSGSDASPSYVAMDIDLNIPLDVTPVNNLGRNSSAEASMGRSSEATDSEATIEDIRPLSQTTATATSAVTQTARQQPAHHQPAGSIMLFGRVICQAPSTGRTNNVPSNNPVVPVTRRRGRLQFYPSGATATSIGRSRGVPNSNQQAGQQAVRMLYGGRGSTTSNGASASAALLPLQPAGTGSSSASALVNMMNQQRQQALVNMTPYSIMRGGVPVLPSHSHLMQAGSSGGAGAGFLNFSSGFSSAQQQQWPLPVLDTSRMMFTYPYYYPGATANQAPATATTTTMPPSTSTGTNNGEGASTSNNARAPPAAGRRMRGSRNSWLSLHRS